MKTDKKQSLQTRHRTWRQSPCLQNLRCCRHKKNIYMCLYPKLVYNPKYKSNKKNKGIIPKMTDDRVKWVPVGCGQCIECRKQKSREWQIRLTEELKVQKHAYFVTLSFSCEALEELSRETKEKVCNATATLAVRRFLERWRARPAGAGGGYSPKHWLITELGHTNTERIHLHGLLFTKEETSKEEIERLWKYGNVYVGDYCTQRTINYVVKYVTKIDETHKDFKQVILCSAGLGKNYIDKFAKQRHQYKPQKTTDYYMLPDGTKLNMPIYYRNKLYTEEEREKLWLEKIDQHTRYVLGIKIENIDTLEGYRTYEAVRNEAQKTNKEQGFGDDSKEWKAKDYNITNKMLNKVTDAHARTNNEKKLHMQEKSKKNAKNT